MEYASKHRLSFTAATALICFVAALSARAADDVGAGYPGRFATPVSTSPVTASQYPRGTALASSQNTVDGYENRPLAFPDNPRRASRAARQEESGNAAYSPPSILSALFYVALVCGVFCAILYLVKKYLPGHRQLFSHPAMEVLGRTHIDQRRYVSLLRVGKRILVVGVSPDEMRSLSEITDEEEITGIMEVARPKTEMGLTIFQRLFKRHVIEAEAEETRVEAANKAREIEEQMSELRERVRSIREREEPAGRRVDAVG